MPQLLLDEVTRILHKHHVDGEALPTLTSRSLMTYGMDQGPSEAISGRVQSLKISPRRLSSGTSGCSDDDGDTDIHTGSSGCTEDGQEQHRGLHTGHWVVKSSDAKSVALCKAPVLLLGFLDSSLAAWLPSSSIAILEISVYEITIGSWIGVGFIAAVYYEYIDRLRRHIIAIY